MPAEKMSFLVPSFEVQEVLVIEGLADFDGSVSSEVEEYGFVSVAHAIVVVHHKLRQVLVAHIGVFAVQRLNGLTGEIESPPSPRV